MKIAFTSTGKEWDSPIDPRFGRTAFIVLFDTETGEFSCEDNQEADKEAHGAGPKTAGKLLNMEPELLITGNGPGDNAATVLKTAGLKIYAGAGKMTVKEAYEAYEKKDKRLQEV